MTKVQELFKRPWLLALRIPLRINLASLTPSSLTERSGAALTQSTLAPHTVKNLSLLLRTFSFLAHFQPHLNYMSSTRFAIRLPANSGGLLS